MYVKIQRNNMFEQPWSFKFSIELNDEDDALTFIKRVKRLDLEKYLVDCEILNAIYLFDDFNKERERRIVNCESSGE